MATWSRSRSRDWACCAIRSCRKSDVQFPLMKSLEEIVIADPQSLADCCAKLRQCEVLGFDTEFVGEETYEPSLCLIQVSTADALYLIDPLSAGPLDSFWQLLVEPARTVVVHA